MRNIERSRIRELIASETEFFVKNHKKSKRLFERARSSLLAGVPMSWMVRWAGSYPIFVERGSGAYVYDVDGHKYLDLCLGDTGSMFGHSPKPVVDAVRKQISRGITMMLPTADSVWVGEELSRRFGLPYWQIAITATDANRFSIRLARKATGRKYILVINGCYHGSVDEALVELVNGRTVARSDNIGPPVDPALTTKTVEFNDIDAFEEALKPRDVACAMLEPAMTNHGIILPEPGYHARIRELCTKYGTLLLIDETHTICCGPGGYTAEYGLKPDIVTLGKPLASGVPVAAYGINQFVADRVMESILDEGIDESGVGGTLSGNALSIAAMKASLQKVITKRNFVKMLPLAKRFEKGIRDVIDEYEMPWHVTRLGVRIEYHFSPTPPKNGSEYAKTWDPELEKLMHLMALNRGILMTPFHNMALISPYTTAKDVDHHTRAFEESVRLLVE